MRCLFGCPDIVSLTEKFLMARIFFRIFTENNPVMGYSKTFFIPEAKGLKKLSGVTLDIVVEVTFVKEDEFLLTLISLIAFSPSPSPSNAWMLTKSLAMPWLWHHVMKSSINSSRLWLSKDVSAKEILHQTSLFKSIQIHVTKPRQEGKIVWAPYTCSCTSTINHTCIQGIW